MGKAFACMHAGRVIIHSGVDGVSFFFFFFSFTDPVIHAWMTAMPISYEYLSGSSSRPTRLDDQRNQTSIFSFTPSLPDSCFMYDAIDAYRGTNITLDKSIGSDPTLYHGVHHDKQRRRREQPWNWK